MQEELRKVDAENERLRYALEYILALTESTHLGRPRLSDRKCVFCMAFFALNNGAYGDEITGNQYHEMACAIRLERENRNRASRDEYINSLASVGKY